MRHWMILGAILAIPLIQGCQAAYSMSDPKPTAPHPFSETERIEDVLARQVQATENTTTAVEQLSKEMRTEMSSISQQVREIAQKQSDLASAISAMQRDRYGSVTPPGAGENPDVPLIDESQVDTGEPVTVKPQDSDNPCIKVAGVDTDLEQYLSEWVTELSPRITFEGTREELIDHLAKHGITGVDELKFPALEKIHAARVEQEIDEGRRPELAKAPEPPKANEEVAIDLTPIIDPTVNPTPKADTCPNGQCPQSIKTVTRSVHVQNSAYSGYSGNTLNRTWSYSKPMSRAAMRRASRCVGNRCR